LPLLLRRVRAWIRAGHDTAAHLLRIGDAEDDLRAEIDAHRAMKEHALKQAGVRADEAERASRRAMGNVTLAREDARALMIAPWIQSAWQDAVYAVRTIRRAPAFAAAMILVTTLGISATTAVFGLIDGLVLADLPVREPARLVWLKDPSFSYPIFNEVRTRGSDIFDGFFAWNMDRQNVQWTAEQEPAEVLMATGDFYSTLGVSAVAGRTFHAEDDRIGGGPEGRVAVISYACWQRRFAGDPAVIGRTLRIDQTPFTIVGVTPPAFFGVAAGLAPEITIPLTTMRGADALRRPTSAWLHLMGRLRDGLTVEQANLAFQTILPSVLEVTTGPGDPADRRAKYLGRKVALEPGRTGFSRVRNQFREPLWMLLALVGLLLAVATASAANLLLARGVARRREVAVRLAIGASRSRVVRQLLTEAAVWTLLGAAFGVPLASAGGGALVAMMTTREEPIALDLSPNWRVLTFTIALALVTAAVCAVLPALRTTRLDPGPALKGQRQIGNGRLRRWSLSQSLVAAQVAVTVLLLAGAALFVRSLQHVLSQDAGFERENVLVVGTDAMGAGYRDGRLMAFYDTLLQRLGAVPGVESASLSWYPPISDETGSWTQSVATDGAPFAPEQGRYVYFNAVSPGYFRTVGTRLLQGRDFVPGDGPASMRVVIVNESLARRFFAGQNPIGRRITIGRHASRRDLEIVGLVQDAKYQRLQEADRSIAYLPHAQLAELVAGTNLVAEVRAGGPVGRVAADVRLAARAVDPHVSIHLETVADRIRESLVKERVIALLATAIGIAALVLACAALYGLLAYTVSRRASEIGVRLALGAGRGGVLLGVIRECLTLAGAGVALGLGAALALGRFARAFLFQMSPVDPVSLIAASTIMLVVAACAGLVPARRAANVNPIEVLKQD
jgi:putative ABC transport system permease protein